MSFQNKNHCMSRDAGSLTDGEIGYDGSSRIEPKRGRQLFVDTPGPELCSQKKQAIEAVGMNISSWPYASSFQSVSGKFSDRLFVSEAVRTNNMVDKNVPSAAVGGNMNINIGRKEFNDQYGCNSYVGFSISSTVEDPSGCVTVSSDELRKVKTNQIRDSIFAISASMGHSHSQGDSNAISMGATYGKNESNAITSGPTNKHTIIGPKFSKADGNFISTGLTLNKGDGNFISTGHTLDKGDGNFILMGQNYNKGNDNILSMGQPFHKVDGNFITMGPSYEKDDGNVVSLTHSFSKGHKNAISVDHAYDKANDNFISMYPSFSKGNDSSISIGASYDKPHSNMTSIFSAQDKEDFNILSMGHNYNKGQTSGAAGPKDFVQSNVDPTVNNAPKANKRTNAARRNTVPSNHFPSNVKSLLSTGIFDGVAVKYVSWSREKEIKGIIKRTGYLCGCQKCDFSKLLNAYEFERHANCKTKHPNDHIYFQNGKSMYAVVQELKNTPQEMLVDTIQNVSGSAINQKNFCSWKESYETATRELQRIYGKHGVVFPS